MAVKPTLSKADETFSFSFFIKALPYSFFVYYLFNHIMKDPAESKDKPGKPVLKLKPKFALLNKNDLLSAEGKQEELLIGFRPGWGKRRRRYAR